MIFFLDENFPKSAAKSLINSDNTIIDIRGSKNEGLSDSEIFTLAQKEKAIFLTTDKDFFNTIPFLFDHHYGIIVIALKRPNSKSIAEKLNWFLDNFEIGDFVNKVIILREESYSIKGKSD